MKAQTKRELKDRIAELKRLKDSYSISYQGLLIEKQKLEVIANKAGGYLLVCAAYALALTIWVVL